MRRAMNLMVMALAMCVTVAGQTPTPPVTQDPTRPPSVERPAPQTPPGTTPVAPTPGAVAPRPAATPAPDSPIATPLPGVEVQPPSGQESTLASEGALQRQPLPPMPSLERLGIDNGNTQPLSLREAVRQALENNNEIEVARDEVRLAEWTLRALEGVYDPVFVATPQINNRVTPIASTLGGSDQSGTVTTTDINYDASVTRLFERGGGQYQFFFNNTRETTSSSFSQLNPFYSSNLGVSFTQPLIRNREIDANRRAIRVQQRLVAQSDADFRRRVTDIIAEVQRAYWDLVFALRDQQNRVANLTLARELFRQTESRIAAGAIAPIARAEVQTELANREAELLVALQGVSFAENTLKRLILRDPLAPTWGAALVPTDEPLFDETPVLLPNALADARANRPELSRLRLQQEITGIDLDYFRNQARPRVDLVGTVSTTGLAGSPVVATGSITGGTPGNGGGATGQVPLIGGNPSSNANAFLLSQINQLRAAQGLPAADVPLITPQTSSVPENLVGGYGQTLLNLLRLNTRNIVVGVRIEIPWRNRTAEANLAGARLRQEQLAATTRAQEQVIEVEVRNSAQSVETARRRVLASREARRNAELQLEGERRLYEVGRSTTFLLFQRENQLTQARNLQLRAETDYNKALADLQRATATTMRANGVTVESPTGR